MRKMIYGTLACALFAGLIGCQKEAATVEEAPVPSEVISQLRDMGFGTDNVQRTEGGYLVEGDMVVTPEMLAGNAQHQKLRIAEVEQYRTFNLVTVSGSSRTIYINTSGSIPTALNAAIDAMITRYNAENLGLRFQRGKRYGDENSNLSIS